MIKSADIDATRYSMTNPTLVSLVHTLRQCYAASPAQAAEAIEACLQHELEALPQVQRLALLQQLEQNFMPQAPAVKSDDLLAQLVTRLLGSHIRPTDLSAPELANRLAQTLDTIFTQLNELIGLINVTLSGSQAGDETIRHIIGNSLEAHGEMRSIEEYLGQIRTAFLTAQQASQEAARTISGFILTELDPKAMDTGGGFKLGAFKKSEAFDLFEEKYLRVRKWFDSERFLVDFLRQFEKQCQKKGGE